MEAIQKDGDLVICTCQLKRCGHRWVARIPHPVVCPKCHSPYWDKVKEEKKDE